MANLNQIVCQDTGGSNTGIPACFLDPKQIIGVIITPVGYTIKAADMATLQTKLQADTMAGAGARIYPLINFVALSADNTQKPVMQNLGYGFSLFVREGNYDLSFQYTDGGLCLHKQLRAFNNKNWGIFLVDADGVLYGYKSGSDLQSIPLVQFYAEPWKMNDGSKVAEFIVSVSFKPQYLNEWVGFLSTAADFDIATSVVGLINLTVSQVTALAAGSVKVQVATSCGGSNLYDQYKAALSLVGAWSATNASTGTVIPIASVTANDADKSFTVAFTTTAPPYPATGGKLNLSLASAADLAALATPMVGYESNVLVETV
ncbi:MAG: hypothetical protein EPN37_07215 [Chitinophagaceae bacterium]|nr:MAG: hypothetical protein EPN37_07215 [Chitinophagaceae bacterium]